MAYTPVEIRHVKLQRGLLGYRQEPVDRLLTEIANSFEDVWRERADLADRIDGLESELARYKELEELVRATLVSAERAAHELRDKVETLEADVARYRELEQLLRATLVSAERAAHELRDQAKREAETIITEARAEAREIGRTMREENEELLRSTRRIRLLLRSTLDALGEVGESENGPSQVPNAA
jgi:cell division initiation protein